MEKQLYITINLPFDKLRKIKINIIEKNINNKNEKCRKIRAKNQSFHYLIFLKALEYRTFYL